MKKLHPMHWALLAAVMVIGLSALARGADAPQQPVIPDGLKGFKGTLAGTVVSVQDNGLGFVLKVTTATAGDGSTASDPQSAVGQSLLVNVKYEMGGNGKYHPAGAQVKYIKGLTVGATTSVTVVNDEKSRLHITAVPTTAPAGN